MFQFSTPSENDTVNHYCSWDCHFSNPYEPLHLFGTFKTRKDECEIIQESEYVKRIIEEMEVAPCFVRCESCGLCFVDRGPYFIHKCGNAAVKKYFESNFTPILVVQTTPLKSSKPKSTRSEVHAKLIPSNFACRFCGRRYVYKTWCEKHEHVCLRRKRRLHREPFLVAVSASPNATFTPDFYTSASTSSEIHSHTSSQTLLL